MMTNIYTDPSMFPMPMDSGINPTYFSRQTQSSSARRAPSFFLPALILFALAWIMHGIATFIPYWSVYSGISDSRAGSSDRLFFE
jgi:hypothetical protein